MAADGAGRRAWRVEQHGVEGFGRLPVENVGGDRLGGELQAREVGRKPLQPVGGDVDGGDVGASGSKLSGLAAGRRAEIGDAPAGDVAEQAGGQRRRHVLDPPGALGVTGKLLDGDRPRRGARSRWR